MEPEEIAIFALKSDQECPEFINPSKGPFDRKAMLVGITVEMSSSSAFHRFSIALVFRNVGNNSTIPEHFPRCTTIKPTSGMKQGAVIGQTTTLQILKDLLDRSLQVIRVIVVASHNSCRCNDVSVLVNYR